MTATAKASATPVVLHAHELVARLRARFTAPEYSFFEEVGDRTGGRTRSADGLAMSLWPSRGLEVHGFEIKVDRRDWLRELKDPAKAESIARFCDRWWLVVGDPSIVHPGELPPSWGLLVPRGDGLLVCVDAPKLDPQPLGRPFLAAIMRAVHKASPTTIQLAQAKEDGRLQGIEEGKRIAKQDRDMAARGAEALARSVADFETASGVKINHFDGGRLGEAVKKVLELGQVDHRRRAEAMAEGFAEMARDLRKMLAATKEADGGGG